MKKSELRQDLVSGDWILIAPGRSKRPSAFGKKQKSNKEPVSHCPFEDPEKGGGKASLIYPSRKNWKIMVIPNKYPAVIHRNKVGEKSSGPYSVVDGVGEHDLLVTRDHDRNFASIAIQDAFFVLQHLQRRYSMLASHAHTSYVSLFHNWGREAGASVYHPHYQIIGIPVVPREVRDSLKGSRDYFARHKKCVHCEILKWERKQKKRIILENKNAIAIAPFASHSPFEVRVFPKKHLPFFEDTDSTTLESVAEVLQGSLKKIERALKHPSYNFFIHTSPAKNKRSYSYYHWHIEIRPKVSIDAGFELETGMRINVVDPDVAAKFLRNA